MLGETLRTTLAWAIEHGTSEMPGMMSLRDHLAGQFPAVEFIWIAEHPRTWTLRGRPA